MKSNGMMEIIRLRNPKAYETMRKLMGSGQNPKEILRKMVSEGRLTRSQLESLTEKAKGFGISVSGNEIDELFPPRGEKKDKGWF